MAAETRRIQPQPGPQERFLSCPADIAIYGGAAGGGKSWALLLEPLRHVTTNGEFTAVFFRRNTTQVRNPGGLWDESAKLYPLAGASAVQHVLEWRWPNGGLVKFAHLEHDSTVYDWQGAQIPLICFDELTHFTQAQFFYMLSRNRSMCGVRPYVRATCNPDADSWVAGFIAWWIDQDTGLPIPERSGVVRWFVRVNDTLLWGDSAQELKGRYGDDVEPKSVTFIAAKLTDNPALMRADPGYQANLKAQSAVERARLLDGNWKIRPAAGMYFKREWVRVIDAEPAGMEWIRYWDLAATEKTPLNDPDWTVGVRMGVQRNAAKKFSRIVVADARRLRESPLKVETAIENTAHADGRAVRIGLFQDPGQAGKSQVASLVRMLAGFNARGYPINGDKVTLFGPFSAQCEAGNVEFVRGPWNDAVFTVLEGFPDAAHDDDADACSGAFNALAGGFAIAAQTLNAPGL
jgi:predicted phage terminase large subunit-like protein